MQRVGASRYLVLRKDILRREEKRYPSSRFFLSLLRFRCHFQLTQLMASVDLCKDSMKDAITPIPKAATACAVPITPEVLTENGDFQSQSPLTLSVVRKQLKRACIDCDSDRGGCVDGNNDNGNGSIGSPRTPKDGVFDPFAPGPDNMARAPNSNKYLDNFRNTVARRLDFHLSFDVAQADTDTLSDEDMFESVYEDLLQVIVSKQAEGLLAQLSDDCETPPFAPFITGIADACPGAPRKPAAPPRNIDRRLCKKLEF